MSDQEEEKTFSFVDKRRISEEGDERISEPAPSDEPESAVVADTRESSSDADPEPQASAPPIDFVTFVLSMSQSALFHMGGLADPVSGKTSMNLDLAKQTIDIIDMLKEKTKGNLSEQEDKLVSNVLYDIKMRFVEATGGGSS